MFNQGYDNDQQENPGQYEDFVARTLYCPGCRSAMPVRERLLLILPDGELYEYVCARCGEPLGDKKVSKIDKPGL
ncbi:MAG: cytoplasmic protein [Candidatus Omnitrophica bacterium]|nr:cytoplasmic protein [Candidatus Omnitrophota bacterium]